MSRKTDFFISMGHRLRDRREDLDLELARVVRETRLRPDWIKHLESGDFEFAEPVFIKGYLKQYTEYLRLDSAPFLTEFDTILEKIHFIENERFIEVSRFNADTDVGPMDVLDVLREPEDMTGETRLDALVRDKVHREKRVNLAVMATATVLISLTAFYLYLDFGRSRASEPYWKRSESVVSPKRVIPKVSTRARMVLSEPLMTEEERELQTSEERFLDSLTTSDRRFVQNLVSDSVGAISIYESADYLRKLYAQ